MKRIVLSILLLNALGSCFAQSIYLSGGISISKLDWKEYDQVSEPYNIYADNLLGYSIGIGTKYLNRKYFNLNTYVGIIKKGGKQYVKYETFPGPLIDKTYSASIQYLDFSESFEIKYKFWNLFQPFFRVGGRINYMINSSYQFDAIEERDELSSFNYGINCGVGFNIEFDKVFIGIFWNKYNNLNKIAKYPPAWGIMGGSLDDQTMLLSIEVGYNIR